MTDLRSDNFFEELPGFEGFREYLQREFYRPLPDDWQVVITDIRGSTKAIETGRYKEVNSVSTASIVALLNAVRPLAVPYVFGGDGATVCVPSSATESVKAALLAARDMAINSFNLDLRVGMVPMTDIVDAGHEILVGKYHPTAHFSQAMFQGNGLGYAETLVKDPRTDNPYLVTTSKLDVDGVFDGFECRWNEVPSAHGESVALMIKVLATSTEVAHDTLTRITDRIFEIYGPASQHHPLQESALSLPTSIAKLKNEARVQTAFGTGLQRVGYYVRLWVVVLIGKWVMARGIKTRNTDWGLYKKKLIENSDYRKFDEVLRMILSGTGKQREKLTTYLDSLRQQRSIVYGMQISHAALITCIVQDYDTDHVHFLDGANGGYALAAKQLKQQLNELDRKDVS
ncbi:MAG: hypothetical protein DHS20C01_32390 [marine bacterium B5-7]|nr:MAG: hypothetical protein DHS20C01_32390 [marine bacterium B5-7]